MDASDELNFPCDSFPWPLIDFPDSFLNIESLQQDLANAEVPRAAPQEGSKNHRASTPTSSLSSESSIKSKKGGGRGGVVKKRRKSRAVPKPPIMELSASKTNYKEMVHLFTGIKTHHENMSFLNSLAPHNIMGSPPNIKATLDHESITHDPVLSTMQTHPTLEGFLLNDHHPLDSFLSLACLVLKHLASQCGLAGSHGQS